MCMFDASARNDWLIESPLAPELVRVGEHLPHIVEVGAWQALCLFQILHSRLRACNFSLCDGLPSIELSCCHSFASREDVHIICVVVQNLRQVLWALVCDGIRAVISIHDCVVADRNPEAVFSELALVVVLNSDIARSVRANLQRIEAKELDHSQRQVHLFVWVRLWDSKGGASPLVVTVFCSRLKGPSAGKKFGVKWGNCRRCGIARGQAWVDQ